MCITIFRALSRRAKKTPVVGDQHQIWQRTRWEKNFSTGLVRFTLSILLLQGSGFNGIQYINFTSKRTRTVPIVSLTSSLLTVWFFVKKCFEYNPKFVFSGMILTEWLNCLNCLVAQRFPFFVYSARLRTAIFLQCGQRWVLSAKALSQAEPRDTAEYIFYLLFSILVEK